MKLELTEKELAYLIDILVLDNGAQLPDWDHQTTRDCSEDCELSESILLKLGVKNDN